MPLLRPCFCLFGDELASLFPLHRFRRTTSSFVGPEYRGRGNPQQQQRVLSLFHTDVAQQCTAQQRLR
jgi:hypothetical protein